jgi:hypothetical protein
MYRVNYCDGQVSQSFASVEDARAHKDGIAEGQEICFLEQYAGNGRWTTVPASMEVAS